MRASKNRKILIIATILLLPLALWLLGCLVLWWIRTPGHPYWGRDTVEGFGNGRFQIVEHHVPWLLDNKTGQAIPPYNFGCMLAGWRRRGDWVYALTDSGWYVVLNYRTGVSHLYSSLQSVPVRHRVKMRNLRRSPSWQWWLWDSF